MRGLTPVRRPEGSAPNGNSQPLPDGRYTLRLKARGIERVAEVVIDTKAPELSDSHVDSIEAQDTGDDLLYAIKFKLKDPEVNGSNSGVIVDSAKLANINSQFTPQGGAQKQKSEDNTYTLAATMPLGDIEELQYSVHVDDKAGNHCEDKRGLALEGVFAGAPTATAEKCSTQKYDLKVLPALLAPAAAPVVAGAGVAAVTAIEAQTAVAVTTVTLGFAYLLPNFCLVPADSDYPDIKDLRARTPFLCPQGQPLEYPLTLWVASPLDLKPLFKVPPISKLNLVATVTLSGEDKGRPPRSRNNEGIWYRTLVNIRNLGSLPTFTWDGKRYDIYGIKDLQEAPTGNYNVRVSFERGIFKSPNQKDQRNPRSNKQNPPGVKIVLPVSEETLVGFRVINNRDGQTGFGPEGFLTEEISDDDDIHEGSTKDRGFNAWKSFIGPAGVGKYDPIRQHDWHHIVEQYQNWIPIQDINRSLNLIRIPHALHEIISLEYRKPHPEHYKWHPDYTDDDDDIPLRVWLKAHRVPFSKQHEIGIKMMRAYCIDSAHPNGYGFDNQTSKRQLYGHR